MADNYIKVYKNPLTLLWWAELRQANHHVLDARSDYPTDGQAALAGNNIWGADLSVDVETEVEPLRVVVIKQEGGWKKVTNETVVEQSDHNWPTNESVCDAAARFPGIPIIMEVEPTTVGAAMPSADEPQDEKFGDPVPDRPDVLPQ